MPVGSLFQIAVGGVTEGASSGVNKTYVGRTCPRRWNSVLVGGDLTGRFCLETAGRSRDCGQAAARENIDYIRRQ